MVGSMLVPCGVLLNMLPFLRYSVARSPGNSSIDFPCCFSFTHFRDNPFVVSPNSVGRLEVLFRNYRISFSGGLSLSNEIIYFVESDEGLGTVLLSPRRGRIDHQAFDAELFAMDLIYGLKHEFA